MPEHLLSQYLTVLLWLSMEEKDDAKHATTMHHTVPPDTKIILRKSKLGIAPLGLANCGRNAIKNKATLGFSTFVKTPCKYIFVSMVFSTVRTPVFADFDKSEFNPR